MCSYISNKISFKKVDKITYYKMDFSKVTGFAEEKNKIEYTGFWDWLVAYNDFGDLWRAQPSFIYLQTLFFIGGFVTLFHAVKNGGRFVHLWIGIALHGLVVEIICHHLSDANNFWHAQTPIMLFGRALPLYEIVIYPAFIYPSVIAADQLSLPRWSEPLAVGLINVLIDYPLDLIGVRFMHWTWHDTDPNISEKHYHVPWNSYYFYAAFSSSFIFWFHLTRYFTSRHTKKWVSDSSFMKELTCTVIAGVFGTPGGVLLFVSIYHPLHDVYKIHSSVTLFLLLSIFLSIVYLTLPKNIQTNEKKNYTANRLILLYLCFYYIFFIGIAAFMDPASEISTSFHEPIGPCNEKVPMKTALGQTLYRRKYLCPTDYDETYFGWSCLPNKQPPKNGSIWYTICGTPFTDRLEYIVILTTAAIVGISFFFKTLGPNCISKNLEVDHKVSLKQKKKI